LLASPSYLTITLSVSSITSREKCDGFVSIGGGLLDRLHEGRAGRRRARRRNINEFQGTKVSEKLANPPHIAINTTVRGRVAVV
jgi:formaldehyde dismutase / methanol dehydrogenase